MKVIFLFLSCVIAVSSFTNPVFADGPQTVTVQATVKKIEAEKITVEVNEGAMKGQALEAQSNPSASGQSMHFSVGEKVYVSYFKDQTGRETVYIVDFVRDQSLFILFFFFLLSVVLIGKWKGFTSFIGMVISFFIIAQFVIPQILAGNDPVLISLLASLFIVPVTFYIAHGFDKKTTTAIAGTFISLVLTAFLSYFFIHLTKLTGFASEEATYIQMMKAGSINIKSLLLAGIIIGALGILNDITIAQTAVIEKLAELNPRWGFGELYSHSMSVGREHIASLVNTLILVYTGAALPLFLLFYSANTSFIYAMNQEVVATEIVRTLVSSIGIIAAVPITTAIAAFFIKK